MLLVVCDSTPLIYLARLDRFDLLRQLHELVLIPQAVWNEVAVNGARFVDGTEVQVAVTAGWMRVETPVGHLQVSPSEAEDLDPGESEALQLAVERDAMIAIDESHGRDVAKRLGLRVTGTVGILVRARHEGLIPALAPELARLRQTTFRVSEAVIREALARVGETAKPFAS